MREKKALFSEESFFLLAVQKCIEKFVKSAAIGIEAMLAVPEVIGEGIGCTRGIEEALCALGFGYRRTVIEDEILTPDVNEKSARRAKPCDLGIVEAVCGIIIRPIGKAYAASAVKGGGGVSGLYARIGGGGIKRKVSTVGKPRHSDAFPIDLGERQKIVEASHNTEYLKPRHALSDLTEIGVSIQSVVRNGKIGLVFSRVAAVAPDHQLRRKDCAAPKERSLHKGRIIVLSEHSARKFR